MQHSTKRDWKINSCVGTIQAMQKWIFISDNKCTDSLNFQLMHAGSEVTEWETGNKLQVIKAEEEPGNFIVIMELRKGIWRSCMGI